MPFSVATTVAPTRAIDWGLAGSARADTAAAEAKAATANAAHLGAHRRIEMLKLDAADREAIQAALRERRGPHGDVFALERDRSGRHGRIMKYELNRLEG